MSASRLSPVRLSLKSAVARKNAFLRSMEEIGLAAQPELVIEGDHTLEGGMTAMAKLRAGPTTTHRGSLLE